MRIRLFRLKDMEAVKKLIIESYIKEDKERRWNSKIVDEYIRRIYKLNKDICFVATENEKVIGVALCRIRPEFNKNILISDMLLVHPKFRKKQIGAKLLKKICNKASNKYNIKEIQTSIYTLLDFPIIWYESIGFKKTKNVELIEATIDNVIKKL